MSTTETRNESARPGRRINGAAIAVLLLAGVSYLTVALSRGEPVAGVIALAITSAAAAVLAVGSRYSDTIALLGDDVHDERHVHVHQRAALYSGNLLMALILGAGVVDLAGGGDGMPYMWLAAAGGLIYVACVLVLSRRS